MTALGEFGGTRKDKNLSVLKKLERLRTYLNFAVDAGWLPANPARKLRRPKVSQHPTMPFAPEQVGAILAACEMLPDGHGRVGMDNAKRMCSLVLLLRHSGLRVRDAATLARERVAYVMLFLYTSKSGVPVSCPLPAEVVEALDSAPNSAPRYFFWSGESRADSAARDFEVRLKKVFRLAGVPDGHAHRFRETFACELLLSGVPIDRVSMLLGHSSIKITEWHHAPWIRARQKQLETDVRASWVPKCSLLNSTKGTSRVNEKG